MMSWRVVPVLLMLLLAGCTSDDGGDGDDEQQAADEALAIIEAPTPWTIGDWWTFDIGGRQVTWVVTEESGSDWILDIDDQEFRFYHDAFAQTSTIGRVTKADLDGSQESGPVRFFDFPLETNKSWAMTWDGIDFTTAVTDVTSGTATLRAEAADGRYREYVYDAGMKWFRSVSAYHADGSEEFTGLLKKAGADYAGTLYRWDIHGPYEYAFTVGEVRLEEFEVPDDATDIWYDIAIECSPGGIEGDQGTWSLHIQPEDGEGGWGQDGLCPAPVEDQDTWETDPGSWGITVASSGARLNITIMPRTLQEIVLG